MHDRALAAVERARAFGPHFLAQFLELHGSSRRPGQLQLRTGDADAPSLLAVATLADIVLGGAVRSCLTPGARMGTVSLSLQTGPLMARGNLAARAAITRFDVDQGTARCVIRASSRHVGTSQAWFTALPAPPGSNLRPVPWEVTPTEAAPRLTGGELDAAERAAIDAACAAASRAREHGTSLVDELLHITWDMQRTADQARGTAHIGSEVANRVGHVQGGVLFAAAARSALHVAGQSVADAPLDGTYHFIRPATTGMLTLVADVVRRGRRVTFTRVTVNTNGTHVGEGLFAVGGG